VKGWWHGRHLSWQRLAGIVALALLALAARSIPALALAACAAALLIAVAVCDRLPWLPHPALDSAGADPVNPAGAGPAAAPAGGP
jgi:hypothetical protein